MKKNKYDLAIIGGGPAGIIAAGHAGELGSRVILLEKNDQLGIKLLITGKGRCNITNAEEDLKKIIDIYGPNGKFLYSALNKFSNKDVIDFFDSRGLKTKIERGNRVFREEFFARSTLSDSLGAFRIDLKGALKKYNNYRPHGALDGLTPMTYISKYNYEVAA